MLVINHQNISELIEVQKRTFVATAKETLRQEFPEFWFAKTEAQIEQLLYDQCIRAKRYDINCTEGIYLMFTMRLRLGWDFPEGKNHAWAREILGRDLVSEAERIHTLETMLWGSGEE